MKLFEYKIIDGVADVSKEAIFCFGRYNPERWIKLGIVEEADKCVIFPFNFLKGIRSNLLKGGFYLIINSPFKFKSDFISTIDFIKKNGIIKNRILFSLRKKFSLEQKKIGWQWTYMNVKCPLDDKCEIDCIDPSGQHQTLA